ncbi:MAG TPA: LysR family transcriptional regulator [Noviherbaspirillum sp.]|nr:LysR family transcriptional regulator [Noviherbaspirillum sp.]
MDLFQAMRVFAKIAETGSLSGAARALDISNPSVTRHISELESYVNARLFNRSTRRLSLTETGVVYLERCKRILADVDDSALLAGMNASSPSGTLKISAPVSFSVNQLATVFPKYSQRYPKVCLDVSLSDRVVDLVEEGYDLAIRIGFIGDSSLVARRVAPLKGHVCASPAYLEKYGIPREPQDLGQHVCLPYTNGPMRDEWRFAREGKALSVRINGSMKSNNGDLLRGAALAGMGIIMQPSFIVGDDIRRGTLVPLLTDYQLPEFGIYAVYPSRLHVSAKVRTFVDYLVETFDADADARLAPGSAD